MSVLNGKVVKTKTKFQRQGKNVKNIKVHENQKNKQSPINTKVTKDRKIEKVIKNNQYDETQKSKNSPSVTSGTKDTKIRNGIPEERISDSAAFSKKFSRKFPPNQLKPTSMNRESTAIKRLLKTAEQNGRFCKNMVKDHNFGDKICNAERNKNEVSLMKQNFQGNITNSFQTKDNSESEFEAASDERTKTNEMIRRNNRSVDYPKGIRYEKELDQCVINNTVFVGNLNINLDEEIVRKYFKKAGEVCKVHLFLRNNPGYGFVEMSDSNDFKEALSLNLTMLLGRRIYVKPAVHNNPKHNENKKRDEEIKEKCVENEEIESGAEDEKEMESNSINGESEDETLKSSSAKKKYPKENKLNLLDKVKDEENGKKMEKANSNRANTGNLKNNPRFKLFVNNLDKKLDKQEFQKYFETAGEVRSVRLIPYLKPERPGYGYVEMSDLKSYEKALSLHHTMLLGRLIDVQQSRTPTYGTRHPKYVKGTSLHVNNNRNIGRGISISNNRNIGHRISFEQSKTSRCDKCCAKYVKGRSVPGLNPLYNRSINKDKEKSMLGNANRGCHVRRMPEKMPVIKKSILRGCAKTPASLYDALYVENMF